MNTTEYALQTVLSLLPADQLASIREEILDWGTEICPEGPDMLAEFDRVLAIPDPNA
jgi:hypothetical protein